MKPLHNFAEALYLCSDDRRRCMRPEELIDSGMFVAWKVVHSTVKAGVSVSHLKPVGDHGCVDHVQSFMGSWQVLTIESLEREEQLRLTGAGE